MTRAERIFHLAQEVTATYDLFRAQRAGSGDAYTREVIDHLKLLVIEEFGPSVANQFISKANRQSVDFWLEDEQTIIELEYNLLSPHPLLEKQVFKALLAKDDGKNVRHLILIGAPLATRHWQTPTPQSVIAWTLRHHQIHVVVWELKEAGKPTHPDAAPHGNAAN